MPELPEVETVRRQLADRLAGSSITEAWAHASPKFASAAGAVGATFTDLGRRGKFLLAGLSGPDAADRELVVHLGMTGSLAIRPSPTDDPYVRSRWWLDSGEVLEFRDVRRFGRTVIVPAGDHRSLPTLHSMGPEPWDPVLDGDGLWRRLAGSTRRVKTALLSQVPIAGVGNIYADEALWRARVHPAARRVSRPKAAALLAEIRTVLADGIADGGTTLRDYRDAFDGAGTHQDRLVCYGRAGSPCLRCGTTLVRRIYDARSTTLCPRCQPR